MVCVMYCFDSDTGRLGVERLAALRCARKGLLLFRGRFRLCADLFFIAAFHNGFTGLRRLHLIWIIILLLRDIE